MTVTNAPGGRSLLVGKLLPSPLYVFRGAVFLREHPELWKYAAAPLGMSVAILGGSYWLLYRLLSGFIKPYGGDDRLLAALSYIVLVGVAILLLVLFFFLFTRIASALSAPFNDLISQKTEELVAGIFTDTPFSVVQLLKDSTRSMYHAVRVLALYLALLLAALFLLLIPGVGSLLFTVMGTLLSAFMFAWEYLGYPLDRRRLTWNQKMTFFRSRLKPALGFGLGNVVVASVPVVNLLFIPAAVIGGTLLFLDMETSEKTIG